MKRGRLKWLRRYARQFGLVEVELLLALVGMDTGEEPSRQLSLFE